MIKFETIIDAIGEIISFLRLFAANRNQFNMVSGVIPGLADIDPCADRPHVIRVMSTSANLSAIGQSSREGWREAALVLAAHGSSRDIGAPEPVLRHAAWLQRHRLFAEVGVGFIGRTPDLAQALGAVTADTVYVVPCFLADGHYTKTVIPEALVAAKPDAPQRMKYCAPIGTSPRLAELVRRRVAAFCHTRDLKPGSVSLLLIGHGTPRHPASSSVTRKLARAMETRGWFARTGVAFLDEPPFVADALQALGGETVVALGLFAAGGVHGADDVPQLLATGSHDARPVHYAGAVGAGPGILGLILERVRAFETDGAAL
jgi:sirohydrochlorin cobaltochelatase